MDNVGNSVSHTVTLYYPYWKFIIISKQMPCKLTLWLCLVQDRTW